MLQRPHTLPTMNHTVTVAAAPSPSQEPEPLLWPLLCTGPDLLNSHHHHHYYKHYTTTINSHANAITTIAAPYHYHHHHRSTVTTTIPLPSPASVYHHTTVLGTTQGSLMTLKRLSGRGTQHQVCLRHRHHRNEGTHASYVLLHTPRHTSVSRYTVRYLTELVKSWARRIPQCMEAPGWCREPECRTHPPRVVLDTMIYLQI